MVFFKREHTDKIADKIAVSERMEVLQYLHIYSSWSSPTFRTTVTHFQNIGSDVMDSVAF